MPQEAKREKLFLYVLREQKPQQVRRMKFQELQHYKIYFYTFLLFSSFRLQSWKQRKMQAYSTQEQVLSMQILEVDQESIHFQKHKSYR